MVFSHHVIAGSGNWTWCSQGLRKIICAGVAEASVEPVEIDMDVQAFHRTNGRQMSAFAPGLFNWAFKSARFILGGFRIT